MRLFYYYISRPNCPQVLYLSFSSLYLLEVLLFAFAFIVFVFLLLSLLIYIYLLFSTSSFKIQHL